MLVTVIQKVDLIQKERWKFKLIMSIGYNAVGYIYYSKIHLLVIHKNIFNKLDFNVPTLKFVGKNQDICMIT